MPQLNALGIVSSDLARSRAVYGLLGIEIGEGDGHVEATTPNGFRLMLDLRDPDGVPVDLYAALP